MDGNGRWAAARGYPRFYGHIRGAARVKEVVRASREIGVRALTLYAFSTENWKRPEEELAVLWKILRKYLRREVGELKKQGIRLNVIGEIDRLPRDAGMELRSAVETLSGGRHMELTFALSYGGRAEILAAAKSIAREALQGKLDPESLGEAEFAARLATGGLPGSGDVDLMIRTSGEKRISNFLLWQSSYAELDFPEVQWPEFTVERYRECLQAFSTRKRRFGGV